MERHDDGPAVISGLELSRAFFEDVVRARADDLLGAGDYAAGLFGPGSEVLGFDTRRSTDHDWGPRVVVVVSEQRRAEAQALRTGLPSTYRDHTLAFGAAHGGAPWIHPVDVVTTEQLFTAWIGFDPSQRVTTVDWLSAPSNGLLMVTAGEVFHDGIGDLTAARAAVAWYPDDVWTWMLGCQWRRISQEQSFVGRAADLDDELGGRILAARLARDAIRLAFLVARRHAPYSKWLAHALGGLDGGRVLGAHLDRALAASNGNARQDALVDAYQLLAEATNGLRLVDPVEDTSGRSYFSRPHRIGPAGELADALLAAAVANPDLARLAAHGAVDQLMDSTDAGWHVARPLYRSLLDT